MSEPSVPAEERLLDLDGKTNDDLRQMLEELSSEEMEVSYRRRVLHGKIDILRAELVHRLKDQHESGSDVISGTDIDNLIKILSNEYRGLLSAGEDDDKQS